MVEVPRAARRLGAALGALLAIYAAKQLGNCGTWFTDEGKDGKLHITDPDVKAWGVRIVQLWVWFHKGGIVLAVALTRLPARFTPC
eukprot:COSAG04_NODE_16832_length_487_cov_1.438144_1_plen_85_part_01